jgi:hypothetical protein
MPQKNYGKYFVRILKNLLCQTLRPAFRVTIKFEPHEYACLYVKLIVILMTKN